MHACGCGFYGDATRECRCTPALIQRYLCKISGPLLDRIDIHVEVPTIAALLSAGGEQEVIWLDPGLGEHLAKFLLLSSCIQERASQWCRPTVRSALTVWTRA